MDGTKTGAGPGVDVKDGAKVSVGVGGGTVGVSSDGLKGVGEAVAFGLGVTVGPTTVGMAGLAVAQAVRRRREKVSRKRRRIYFFFQITPRRGWKRKTSRKMAVAVSTMAEPETMFK